MRIRHDPEHVEGFAGGGDSAYPRLTAVREVREESAAAKADAPLSRMALCLYIYIYIYIYIYRERERERERERSREVDDGCEASDARDRVIDG